MKLLRFIIRLAFKIIFGSVYLYIAITLNKGLITPAVENFYLQYLVDNPQYNLPLLTTQSYFLIGLAITLIWTAIFLVLCKYLLQLLYAFFKVIQKFQTSLLYSFPISQETKDILHNEEHKEAIIKFIQMTGGLVLVGGLASFPIILLAFFFMIITVANHLPLLFSTYGFILIIGSFLTGQPKLVYELIIALVDKYDIYQKNIIEPPYILLKKKPITVQTSSLNSNEEYIVIVQPPHESKEVFECGYCGFREPHELGKYCSSCGSQLREIEGN